MKILVISHLAFNNTNNVGKTLCCLFRDFSKEELAQLYFSPIQPNVDKCSSYYAIKDKDVLHSIIGSPAGHRNALDIKNTQALENNVYKRQVKKTKFNMLLRDLLWKIGRINYKDLYLWIDVIKPDVIFLAPGNSVFPYRISRKISKDKQLPVITFLMDDFYYGYRNTGLVSYIRNVWLRKAIRESIKESTTIYSVSQEMADLYSKAFKKQIDVLYTPVDFEIPELKVYQRKKNNLVFLYAGSLGLERWKVLCKIAESLNNHPGSKLVVYSSPTYKEPIRELSVYKSFEFGGFVDAKTLIEKINASDVVLHVESFNDEMIQRTLYSVSTKIPECLASGKVFLAIGNPIQAGINYLKKNEAAYVCTSLDDIEKSINEIHDPQFDYSKYLKNANRLMQTNHNAVATKKILTESINNIIS